ncbi:TetR/AcrR family transcriptional regulator [Allokutzneria oryzae]|uniref:TetR/AcrR family transcriptional regulator n=1 Tax=Allokutzneria oryzae TaxID=1378989 RepID=A0ABV6A2W8_9PSEU
MPKQVDHEERRAAIAHALWSLAGDRGLDRVSLRDVAREAGMSLGQLQHYFGTREEMLFFTMDFISERSGERTRARIQELPEKTPYAIVHACLCEMLPLDAHARQGSLMSISYYIEALRNDRLREHARDGAGRLLALITGQLELARERREIPADRDPRREAMLIMSIADGLTSYCHLGLHTAEEALAMARSHLDRLFAAAPAHETKR